MRLYNFATAAVIGFLVTLTACNQDNASNLETPNAPAQQDTGSKGNARIPRLHYADMESSLARLHPDSTLLAHKLITLPDQEHPFHVIVLRGIVPNTPFDHSQNPCELMVLREAHGSYIPVASSKKAVDCTNIIFFRDVATRSDDLDDNLITDDTPGLITFVNEYARSTSQYSFQYLHAKDSWILSSVMNNYPVESTSGDEMLSVTEVVRYPEDIDRIAMEDFDPADLVDQLAQNRVVK